MRTQVSFKQFKPSKPVKYRFLGKSISAAGYPYIFAFLHTVGSLNRRGVLHFGYWLLLFIQNLIETLASHIDLKGSDLPFDQYYLFI